MSPDGAVFANIRWQDLGVSMPSSQITPSQAPTNALSFDSSLLDELSAIVKKNNTNLLERESALAAARQKTRGTAAIGRQYRRARERRRFANTDRYQRGRLIEFLSYAGELLSSGRISSYTYARIVTIASSTFIEAHAENALARYANQL
jgi:hypothetical protein